ncbi:MAG: translocation/assembly module TamB domain-containing protein, partial [Oligoflexia bacterium]|nr:translocation/assembly module TamB domain-containing protein [Oligoflexia bacterium]
SVMVPFFREFEGQVKGQILINNNLKKLQPKGSLQIEDALFSLYSLPDFTNVTAHLVFANNNIIVNDFNASAGGGQVKGMGNIFYNFMDNPILNLNLNFDKVYFQIPEGFNTKGSGKIKIKGSSPPYLISGEYDIDSGSIVREFSSSNQDKQYDFTLLDKKNMQKKSIFDLNLNLKTKQAVSVNSSLIRSFIEGQANIYGPFSSLLINGNFTLSENIKQSLIFFRGQEFKIRSGFILFKDSNPANPYLNISADTVFKFKEQVIDSSRSEEEIERQYKILLSVKGAAQNLDFSLKSIPTLNETEIISLLTLGFKTRDFDTKVKQNITDYSAHLLTSLLIEKHLNKEIKNTLGLDFRLTPYINTLNKPVTKITFSKNWFDKWRTSFSQTLEELAQSDIRLKYDLNEQISLTAFWENKGQMSFQDIKEDFLGLDFEFNFDF